MQKDAIGNFDNAKENFGEHDVLFMRRCLDLAARAEGRTSPNPMVGAVIVDESGTIVGEGFHSKAGEAHAEVVAFQQAGERAKGGTLYVNLEPCSHFGRTPPCADAVIASGVTRVVAAMVDPNPKVAGSGFQKLRDHGIELVIGVLEREGRWLNRGFLKVKTEGRPWVCLKIAATLDGRIADRFSKSQWITGPEARRFVHELRNKFDCVLVGAGTARADNPTLNVRDIENSRDPKRAVVDSSLSVTPNATLCREGTGGDTILFCRADSVLERGTPYASHVSVVSVQTDESGSGLDLNKVLAELTNRDVSTVLCEGGSQLAGSLLEANLVDELYWISAPKLLLDAESKPAIAVGKAIALDSIREWKLIGNEKLANDLVIHLTSPSNPFNC
jgi:riboflavin biosynthesis protein RibD